MATPRKKPHLVEELEKDFHLVHNKLTKAKDRYLADHQKEVRQAKKVAAAARKKLAAAKQQLAKSATAAKKSGSRTARNQLKKARAAASLMADSVVEATSIMKDKEANLRAARPFERKLAARAKALEAFERDWTKKMRTEEAARKRKAAAAKKKKATSRKPQPKAKSRRLKAG